MSDDDAVKKHAEWPTVPAYPEGEVIANCVCGSWPGGKCLRCPRIEPKAKP